MKERKKERKPNPSTPAKRPEFKVLHCSLVKSCDESYGLGTPSN
jgi:hypothetical protein